MSIVAEKLNQLAAEAAATTGAGFIITFVKGKWKINFMTARKSFECEDIGDACSDAIEWIEDNRVDITPTSKKYKIKDNDQA